MSKCHPAGIFRQPAFFVQDGQIIRHDEFLTKGKLWRSPICTVAFRIPEDSRNLVLPPGTEFQLGEHERFVNWDRSDFHYIRMDEPNDQITLIQVSCEGDLMGMELIREMFGTKFLIEFPDNL